jgi:hypothetical protein
MCGFKRLGNSYHHGKNLDKASADHAIYTSFRYRYLAVSVDASLPNMVVVGPFVVYQL